MEDAVKMVSLESPSLAECACLVRLMEFDGRVVDDAMRML
jgi:hypothetical protein